MVTIKLGPQREAQMRVLNLHIFSLPCTCTLNGPLRTRNDWQVFFIPSALPKPKHKASCLRFCCLATTTSLITRVFLSCLLRNWVHGATMKKAKACLFNQIQVHLKVPASAFPVQAPSGNNRLMSC